MFDTLSCCEKTAVPCLPPSHPRDRESGGHACLYMDVSLWTKPQGIHAVDAIPTIVGGENHNTNSL